MFIFRKMKKQVSTIVHFALLIIFCSFPSILAANNAAITCVQSQLNELGFDAGAIDGLLGKRSKTAYDAHVIAEQLDTDIKLTYPNAQNVCRRIGLHSPGMQQFWPAKNARFDFIFSSTTPKPVQDYLKDQIAYFDRNFSYDFNVQRAGTDDIVVATNWRELKNFSLQSSK